MEKKTSGDKYYEKILDWFNSQILSGELKQGDVIPSERELAARFGVSRVPVREALRILEYIGIIRNTPEGMVVQQVDIQLLSPKADFAAQITRDTIEDLFEVRIFLESAAAYYAASRRTEDELERMRQSLEEMLKAIEDPEREETELIAASHQFHFYVIEAAKNPVLENIYRNLFELLEVSKQYTLNRERVSSATLMDHEAILAKIEAKKPDEAAKYMRFHLLRAAQKMRRSE